MTPLPSLIRKGGFELTMIKRVGQVAIYRQHLPGGNPEHDAYEVILPQVRNTNHEGEPVEPYEAYPSAESWGKKGWTFTGLAKAVQKFKQLAQKASRAGTVSRKNRLDGQRRSRGGRLVTRPSLLRLPRHNFESPVGLRRQRPVQRNVNLPPAGIRAWGPLNT
jgi:hypothetical protein